MGSALLTRLEFPMRVRSEGTGPAFPGTSIAPWDLPKREKCLKCALAASREAGPGNLDADFPRLSSHQVLSGPCLSSARAGGECAEVWWDRHPGRRRTRGPEALSG